MQLVHHAALVGGHGLFAEQELGTDGSVAHALGQHLQNRQFAPGKLLQRTGFTFAFLSRVNDIAREVGVPVQQRPDGQAQLPEVVLLADEARCPGL
ncbi:hypothetical protein D3C81_1249430 [compost metagenome]